MRFVDELPEAVKTTPASMLILASELRHNPGRWALIRVYPKRQRNAAYTYASNVRAGRIKSLDPTSGFTAKAQSDGAGNIEVWARWQPPVQ